MNKIFKPKTCLSCPVCHAEKEIIYCGVNRTAKASKKSKDFQEELNEMHRNCLIDWDK